MIRTHLAMLAFASCSLAMMTDAALASGAPTTEVDPGLLATEAAATDSDGPFEGKEDVIAGDTNITVEGDATVADDGEDDEAEPVEDDGDDEAEDEADED